MKYIRTKDGIYEVEKKERAYFEGQPWLYYCKGRYGLVEEKDILNQSDTIEELIQDNDILYIHDLYPDAVLVVEGNIKPFGYDEPIALKEWLTHTWVEFDLYIKNNDGNYIKVATKEREEKLELL